MSAKKTTRATHVFTGKTVGDLFAYLDANNLGPNAKVNDIIRAVDPNWQGDAGDETGNDGLTLLLMIQGVDETAPAQVFIDAAESYVADEQAAG